MDPLGAALTHIRRQDPVMRDVIGRVRGQPAFETGRDPFTALCTAIIHQQLSGKAAATIQGRFLGLFPRNVPTAAAVAKTHWSKLRGCGLSKQKRAYLQDLAARCLSDEVEIHDLHHRSDDEIIEELTSVLGIGRWTAQMFLMFTLGRPDVFPEGDLGIVNGMRALYRKPRATGEQLSVIAEPWRPYRTYGCWYVWRYKDTLIPPLAGTPNKP